MDTTHQQPGGAGKSQPPVAVELVNYYRTLGVRVNATPKSIRAGYEAKIKEYPEEQYPEESGRIREAYENLIDPVRRDEYDFTRKNGSTQKLDVLIGKGTDAFAAGDFRLAEELFRQVLELKPDHSGASIALSGVYLAEDKLDSFTEVWRKVEELSSGPRQTVIGTMLQIRVLLQYEKYEQALKVVRALDQRYRAWRRIYITDYADVLMLSGRGEEAWKLYEETLEEVKESWNGDTDPELRGDLLQFYIYWIKIMVSIDKMQFWNKIKQHTRAYLRSLPEGEEQTAAVDQLTKQIHDSAENFFYKEAVIFADLAHNMDPKNPVVQQLRKEVQAGNKLFLETDRLMKDRSMYSGVKAQAHEFFTKKVKGYSADDPVRAPEGGTDSALGSGSGDYFMTEGIKLLRRKYPLVYKAYQRLWERLM